MKVVTFGELMIRLQPYNYERFVQADHLEFTFGGGEANVAVSLANYGAHAIYVTKLPAHAIGQAAVNSLRRYGVDTTKIVRGGDRVGIYFNEKGASQRGSVCIYDRAHSAIQEASTADFDWDSIFEGVDWFHFTGITPALGPNVVDICREACKAAKAHGVKISCDLNYRGKLWTREEARVAMTDLCQYVDVCISNEEDAKDVFGIDDSAAVGEKVKDWDTLKATAAELKAKGYYTFASYADTFRLYGNSISEPWVTAGETTVKVDPQIMNWIKDSKEWLDAGYFDKTVKGQWNNDWNKSMSSSSKVFAFLLPAWGIDFTLNPNWDGETGAWGVTNPPQEYNWGGSYIHAATGTDNPQHVKDIILALTANKDNLIKISRDYLDFTNTVSGMQEAATDASFASDFLGGQNAYEYFAPVAENIQIAPLSSYDQGCVELIQNAFSDYFQGNVDYDRAKSNFETAIKERYPDITEIQWAE